MKHIAFLALVIFFSLFGAAYNAGIALGDIIEIMANPYVALYTAVIIGAVIVTVAAVSLGRTPKKQKKKEEKRKEKKEETYFNAPKGGEYRSEYY